MLWDVLLRGILMGFAVAAPVGPIGVLCIRRTLNDGRSAGLATGIGAATADATYGLLVAVGFVASGVLDAYATPMAIGGGVLLGWLGAASIRGFVRSGKDSGAAPVSGGHQTIFKSWVTTFVLTMANPMTILIFVGMIAGLGEVAAGSAAAPYWLVIGVFLGSALWWLFLVHLALMVRMKMTQNLTRWFDLASGLVLVIWGVWIAVSALI